jgi:hydroxypyruvate isomerase
MNGMTRRRWLSNFGASGALLALPSFASAYKTTDKPTDKAGSASARVVKIGRLKQSVSRWCFKGIPLPDLCKAVKEMGLGAIDLLEEPDWAIARDHGLVCSMAYAGSRSIPEGFNDLRNHDPLLAAYEAGIPKAAKFGWPNVIAFFGNRKPDISEGQAFDNCVKGLQRLKPIAEQNKITICVELLNSKVNHKGYQGDRVEFGLKVMQAVASPRIKLLYDIYHVQIMDGDIIRTIRNNKEWLGHFHTGGVPGRHELDDTQELNWRTVARAVADTGFTGYFAHEFVPTRDPLTSLREAVAICDV